jgi:hypothetical protein
MTDLRERRAGGVTMILAGVLLAAVAAALLLLGESGLEQSAEMAVQLAVTSRNHLALLLGMGALAHAALLPALFTFFLAHREEAPLGSIVATSLWAGAAVLYLTKVTALAGLVARASSVTVEEASFILWTTEAGFDLYNLMTGAAYLAAAAALLRSGARSVGSLGLAMGLLGVLTGLMAFFATGPLTAQLFNPKLAPFSVLLQAAWWSATGCRLMIQSQRERKAFSRIDA